jgi:hypothetical protein
MKTQILTSDFNQEQKLPDDDQLMIETCWSDFVLMCGILINVLLQNKCISWTKTHREDNVNWRIKTNIELDELIFWHRNLAFKF